MQSPFAEDRFRRDVLTIRNTQGSQRAARDQQASAHHSAACGYPRPDEQTIRRPLQTQTNIQIDRRIGDTRCHHWPRPTRRAIPLPQGGSDHVQTIKSHKIQREVSGRTGLFLLPAPDPDARQYQCRQSLKRLSEAVFEPVRMASTPVQCPQPWPGRLRPAARASGSRRSTRGHPQAIDLDHCRAHHIFCIFKVVQSC